MVVRMYDDSAKACESCDHQTTGDKRQLISDAHNAVRSRAFREHNATISTAGTADTQRLQRLPYINACGQGAVHTQFSREGKRELRHQLPFVVRARPVGWQHGGVQTQARSVGQEGRIMVLLHLGCRHRDAALLLKQDEVVKDGGVCRRVLPALLS